MPNVVTIDIETRFTDNATAEAKAAAEAVERIGEEAKKAGKELDDLGKKEPKVTPEVDPKPAKEKVDAIQNTLNKLKRSKTRVVLDALDNASQKVANVLSKVKKFSGRTFSAMMNLKDSGAVSSLKKVTGTLENVTRKTWSVAVKIKDLATAPLRGIKNMLFSIQSLVTAIVAGWAAKQLIFSPISTADAYSSAQIGFSTLLGESGGQQMMDDLDEFAKRTPFNTSSVISNAQKMMAMGWDTDTLIEDMEVLGNAAAATGKLDTGLEQIVRAMAQIKTKGRLSTEELNQLAEAGISAKAMLAEELGYGTGDAGIAAMTEDLEKGAIASDVAIEALLKGMEKYNGMMDSMANETFEGLKSQLQDAFEINIVRRWGQGLQDGAKRGLGTVLELLDKSEDALAEFGDMLYEIGKTASNWVADKLENAVKRITEITGTYEFKNANLGEKISMLWKGVIADPLKEWWDNGGQKKTAETAGKIGKWMGEMLTKGILALLGVTDILSGSGLDESGGASVAQSFAKGFTEAFDVSAITDKLKEAISNVWNVLPGWAKALLIGYGGSKLAIGGANLISAIGSLGTGVINAIGGFSIASSTFPHLTSSGSGILGFLGKLGLATSGATTAGGAILAGAGSAAGGIAAGYSLFSGISDFVDAVQYKKEGDMTNSKASLARAGSTIGGAGIGATIGTLILPGVGTLIGAGIGGLVGKFGGDKWSSKIKKDAVKTSNAELAEAMANDELSEAEKAAALQKAIWQDIQDHMGDVELTLAECEQIAKQIVWGDAIESFETFSAAVATAQASLETFKTSGLSLERWLWKAGLGVKFSESEIESIKATFDEYINSAKSYVENKHYEFTAAVSLLIDPTSETGKSIIEGGNAYYGGLEAELEQYGKELGDALTKALEDGIITAEENDVIIAAQEKIAAIIEKISNAEYKAQIELNKFKFTMGNLSQESYESLVAALQQSLSERKTSLDEAFVASVTSLQLQLEDGAITQEQYKDQVDALKEKYKLQIDALEAEVKGIELDMIDEAYGAELGENSRKILENALHQSLAQGINPKDWTADEARAFLGVDSLSDETAGAIALMLGTVADTLGTLDMGSITTTADVTVVAGDITVQQQATILQEEFGIPYEKAASVMWMVHAEKTVEDKITLLCEEFGIERSYAQAILFKLTGEAEYVNTLSVTGRDFGLPSRLDQTVSVDVTARLGKVTNKIPSLRFGGNAVMDGTVTLKQYRGGIIGRAGGGVVQGGTQLYTVAEEGSPEMIIPLGKHRRERAMQLWEKTGELLGAEGFARGGRTDHGDEGIRFLGSGSGRSEGNQSVNVDVGGVSVSITVEAGSSENIVATIKSQAAEIAEEVAGYMADAFSAQFAATPVRG